MAPQRFLILIGHLEKHRANVLQCSCLPWVWSAMAMNIPQARTCLDAAYADDQPMTNLAQPYLLIEYCQGLCAGAPYSPHLHKTRSQPIHGLTTSPKSCLPHSIQNLICCRFLLIRFFSQSLKFSIGQGWCRPQDCRSGHQSPPPHPPLPSLSWWAG